MIRKKGISLEDVNTKTGDVIACFSKRNSCQILFLNLCPRLRFARPAGLMICEHDNGPAKAGEVPNLLIGLSTFAVCV